MNHFIEVANRVIALIFTVAYFYQIVYIFVALLKKPKKYPETDQSKKYAILISARNEEAVLGNLLDSINNQDYPSDNITVFVVADNCTDNTAAVAEQHGAKVYTRFNHNQVGKGFALEYLMQKIDEEYSFESFEGFFVFDADNVLMPDYITQMDRAHCAGYESLTSYRNSKNFADNWISSGYAIWFLREAKYLNNPRSILGTSCSISGTGFFFSSKVARENEGWKYYLLTEDIEFSTDQMIRGAKIGYCHDAMFFDEQPTEFSQSWRQRLRWSKGFFQILHSYGGKLVKGVMKGKYACLDMLLYIAPAFILTTAQVILAIANIIFALVTGNFTWGLVLSSVFFFVYAYALMWVYGILVLITERKKIICPTWKLILYSLTFPLFMFTYLPITWEALFKKVKWDPVKHTQNKKASELKEIIDKQ